MCETEKESSCSVYEKSRKLRCFSLAFLIKSEYDKNVISFWEFRTNKEV